LTVQNKGMASAASPNVRSLRIKMQWRRTGLVQCKITASCRISFVGSPSRVAGVKLDRANSMLHVVLQRWDIIFFEPKTFLLSSSAVQESSSMYVSNLICTPLSSSQRAPFPHPDLPLPLNTLLWVQSSSLSSHVLRFS